MHGSYCSSVEGTLDVEQKIFWFHLFKLIHQDDVMEEDKDQYFSSLVRKGNKIHMMYGNKKV